MTHEHHDRDVVVERDGGTGVGTIIGIILAVVIVLALIWFFGFGGWEGMQQPGTDININLPAPGDGGGGEQLPPEPAP